MTVAHDAATESAVWTTTPDPFTFDHTPVGTPRGVLVLIVGVASGGGDQISGVTYGGVAMTRDATNGFASDIGTEPGSSYAYLLGASIPTGTQTVSIDHTAVAVDKWAVAISVTAAADTEITVSGKLENDTNNPQIALDTSAVEALRYAVIYSGLAVPTDLTPVADTTAVHDVDFGTRVGLTLRQTTAGSGSFTIGWTAANDDVAMVAVAIQEVSSGATVDPFPYVGGGYYPTEG